MLPGADHSADRLSWLPGMTAVLRPSVAFPCSLWLVYSTRFATKRSNGYWPMNPTIRAVAAPQSLRDLFGCTLLLLLLSVLALPASAQMGNDPDFRTPFTDEVQPEWLAEVMPQADRFSGPSGEPPVWEAWQRDSDDAEELAGYVFRTADWPPEERGYTSPVSMLVGLGVDNVITGVKLLNYREAYRSTRGDFLGDARFLSQFRDRSIRDEFRFGDDIDGLASATVSAFAVARGARNAARRVAETHLGFTPGDPVADAVKARVFAELDALSWEEMLESGIVRQIQMATPGEQHIEFTTVNIGHPILAEYFIGERAYTRTERDAQVYGGNQNLILLGIGGSAAGQFRLDRMGLEQGRETVRRMTANRFVSAGNADAGRIAGRANFAGAIVLPERFDPAAPVSINYRPFGSFEDYSLEVAPVGLARTLVLGEPVLSEAEIEAVLRAHNSFWRQLQNNPPWGVTPWEQVGMLVLVLALVMAAFLSKRAALRWIAMTVTLIYLGFVSNGFVSVSHIVSAITQGPANFLNNLPLLIILVFTLVITLIWGRVFCSSLCPFGAVQDFIARFTPKRWQWQLPQTLHERALWVKYAILAFIVVMAVVAADVAVFQYFEPFGTLFFLSGTAVLVAILLAFLAASVVIPRFYCRYACPLGAALGVVSLLAPLRIRRVPQCGVCTVCEHACPTGAIRREKIDFKECVRCDICEVKLIRKAGSCRHDMDKIIVRHKELRPA